MSLDANQDAGRLFEAGFMVGVVREIATLPQPPTTLAHYQAQCSNYHLDEVLDLFAKHGGASREGRERARLLGQYYFFKGFMSGYTFLREYLQALCRRYGESVRTQERARKHLEVLYWQCTLIGKNRLESPTPQEEYEERQYWLSAFAAPPPEIGLADTQMGGFLNADLLLMVRDSSTDNYDLLAVDPSAFGPGDFQRADFTRGSTLLQLLHRDVRYLTEKGAFARLEMELGDPQKPLFTEDLTTYFTAFASSDRESIKLIQAGSYAQSFRAFLQRHRLLPATSSLTYHIAGYSDRGQSMLTLGPDDSAILAACAHIYPNAKQWYRDDPTPILTARAHVLRYLTYHLQTLFGDGRMFARTLRDAFTHAGETVMQTLIPSLIVTHTETLDATSNVIGSATTFQGIDQPLAPEVLAHCQLTPPHPGSAHVRWAHTQLVHRALADPQRRYVFLTGNPGIGKTTALSTYIQDVCQDEGYLVVYASPRKTVNQDIFEKFRRPDGSYIGSRFLGLTTNSDIIHQIGGYPVLYVGSASALPAQTDNGIAYLSEDALGAHQGQRATLPSRVKSLTANTLIDTNVTHHGVIETLSKGIGAALSQKETNTIVAAVALQALKLRQDGKDTLEHLFRGIFRDAYLPDNAQIHGQVFIEEIMRRLARTTRHIIVMIDELTGDDGGYAFFARIAEQLNQHQLEQYGFAVKLVVADASLAEQSVVQSHLRLRQKEPDARKIYVGQVDPEQATHHAAISATTFKFDSSTEQDAWLINTNAFPASHLHLRYAITVPLVTLPTDMSLPRQRKLFSPREIDIEVDATMIRDICAFLTNHPDGEQAIVYVQNKLRLGRIIDALQTYQQGRGVAFERGQHFLEIHAEISDEQAAQVRDVQQRAQFQIFFITSSASRGLTFAQTRFLFIDIPRFQIETQLMEIIQVMYRGRGAPHDHSEKWITFYLSDRLFFHETETAESRRARLQEEQLDLTTMLALLKMSILTRITGSAPIRDQAYSVIPIGGKSLGGAGRAVHHDLATLYQAIQRDLSLAHRNDPTLQQLERTLAQLLDEVEIAVPTSENSLLHLYEHLSPARLTKWMFGEDPLPEAFVLGSLLIVPIVGNQKTQAAHLMGLTRAIALATHPATLTAIRTIYARHGHYAPAIHEHIRELDDLVEELSVVTHSQRLERAEALRDSYYAVPLAMFVAKEAIIEWCASLRQDEAGDVAQAVRGDFVQAIRSQYPLDSLLPVSARYHRFPYVVVTSRDLAAMRQRMWRQGHLCLSQEMNLLTMLLAQHLPFDSGD